MLLHRPTQRDQSGFSIIEVSLVVLIVAALAVTGFVVYQRHKPSVVKNSVDTSTIQANTQPKSTATTQPAPDPYAGWQTYSNSTYGISYKYPTNWVSSGDVVSDATTRNASVTRLEFSTGLKLTTDTKYNNTVEIEVWDEPLQTAEAWYDQYYAQTPIKVAKTTDNLKSKQSVQYDFKAPTYESKQYLFAVGSKTYTFSSINESLNVQNDANYWSKFDNTFASLTIK